MCSDATARGFTRIRKRRSMLKTRADILSWWRGARAGTPTQYLTGKQEFWGLEFEVTPAVLIPRPETEHIVEVALERLGRGRKRMQSLRIADVGTGSGCIAVALAHEFPRAEIFATDISADGAGCRRAKCGAA